MGLPAPDPDPHAAVLSPEVDLCLELGRSLQRAPCGITFPASPLV